MRRRDRWWAACSLLPPLLLLLAHGALGVLPPEASALRQPGSSAASALQGLRQAANGTANGTAPSDKPAVFTDPSTEKFIHMAVNSYTGQVYVGGVNSIYQLSSKLELQARAMMGPEKDDPGCPVTRFCPSISKKPHDYYNKALVIDYPQSRLIACGSLFQGVCTVHSLENITNFRTPANESVVANNATASTVAFIANGPERLSRMHVLYVAVSFTGNGPYRAEVPAISSRSLDLSNDTFSVAVTGVSTGTKAFVNSLAREVYPITYVFGFSSRGFSYFLTVQKQFTAEPKPYISKLVRICQNDVHYYSYTEVALVCHTPDGVHYNLAQAAFVGRPGSELAVSLGITAQDEVLFVVFAKSRDETDVYNRPGQKSALCVYALTAVHRKFTQNINDCFNGEGVRGLDFINPSTPCQLTQVQINDDFCGMDVNTPLDGGKPVNATPVLTYSNVLLTSVAAVSTHDYTVAFLGTSTGHLKKVVVESVTNAFEYSDSVIEEGKAVNPDMLFDKNGEHLYVMTERTVTRVKVQECHQYKTCIDCLGAQDPYCGWCSLENKCSLRSNCAEAAQDPLYWLSYKSGKCTTITSVQPAQIQRTTARHLSLVIGNLPVLEGQFFCAFTAFSKTLETNATRSANGVSCPTPHTDSLPSIPPGEHHFTAKLSVRMKSNPDFVATNFTFYDCSTYTSCTQCVSSPFPCDWCVGGHRCTHDTGENCRNDILVTGVSSVGPSIRSGPGFCPRINATTGISTEILVPMGINKRIQVKVENIQPFIASTRFVCQFNIEGRVKQVNAQLLGDTIYCENMQFNYGTQAPNITAAFAVIWEGSKPLDNPENIHVLVYRCENMSENCGLCLELPEKYACGWCQQSNSCKVQEQCDGHATKWLERTQTCPDPQVTRIYPTSGPWEGGTNITIEGYNLGRVFQDIQNGIHVSKEVNGVSLAQIPCIPHKDLYVKTTRIVCEIESPRNLTTSPPSGTISGPVIVKVLNDYTAKSKQNYSFVNPRITSINPSKGPKSGGTRLLIWGLHMDAGSHAEAFVGGMPCQIITREPNVVSCNTSASNTFNEGKVRVKFDKGLRLFEDYIYLYVEDPEIEKVESGSARHSSVPRGIPSGGITVTVKGRNLNAVQEPMMYITLDGEEHYSRCIPDSAQQMKCKSPAVPRERLSFGGNPEVPVELEYGFRMDAVQQVRNLWATKGFPPFHMFPDPEYFPFTERDQVKYYKSDYLTINGNNLDRACQESDVIVRIGTSICNVTSLSRVQLTCRPPTDQPPAQDRNGNPDRSQIPQVVVEVGDRLVFMIGWLRYKTDSCTEPTVPANTTTD